MQDDEGKRRRLASEASQTCGGTGGGGGGGGDDSRLSSSSSASSASSSGTQLEAEHADPQPLTRAVEDMLRSYLAAWGQRLVALQPKVGADGRVVGAWTGGVAARSLLVPLHCCTPRLGIRGGEH